MLVWLMYKIIIVLIPYLGVDSQDILQDILQGVGLDKMLVQGLHNSLVELGTCYCSNCRHSSSQVVQVVVVVVVDEHLACGLNKHSDLRFQ